MSNDEFSLSAGGRKPLIKRIGRHVALSLPVLRPLIKNKERHAAEANRLAVELAHSSAEAKRLAAEAAHSVERREAVEVELYMLRSTHQRTVARNEELQAETQRLRAARAQ